MCRPTADEQMSSRADDQVLQRPAHHPPDRQGHRPIHKSESKSQAKDQLGVFEVEAVSPVVVRGRTRRADLQTCIQQSATGLRLLSRLYMIMITKCRHSVVAMHLPYWAFCGVGHWPPWTGKDNNAHNGGPLTPSRFISHLFLFADVALTKGHTFCECTVDSSHPHMSLINADIANLGLHGLLIAASGRG